jgi:MOSC domain-containing protein YiiM
MYEKLNQPIKPTQVGDHWQNDAMSMTLKDLTATFPRPGAIVWMGLRPARQAPMLTVTVVEAVRGSGLRGDHYAGRDGKREVTLIQAEHLAVIAALSNHQEISPTLLRRNLVVSGLNLNALGGLYFRVGATLLQATGACHPCSRMEQALGPGGYQAMRGHGGITARILESGVIRMGDSVEVLPAQRSLILESTR